ncbi:GAF domain-containing protein [Deinococcus ruber]|uniref:histidine kinase n=1 Tax=Deinococcus ruber TaxID=1848197 RepID=A0A918F6J0_9DEIO|nr:GAF domain-containing protein [Deinococcus ruber]GGR13364.1 hypothetical protein GCM10008957_27900 [Deinococcus ruber]
MTGDALAAHRTQALADVTSRLIAVKAPADVGRAVMQAGRHAAGAFGATVYVLDGSGQQLDLLISSGYGPVSTQWSRLDLARSLPVTDSVRRAEALFLDQQTYLRQYPDLPRQAATCSTAVLPLRAGARTLGVLGFSFDRDHPFPEDERTFLLTLANQCAIALERAQAMEAAERAARQATLLARASERLDSEHDPDAVLRQLVALVVPELAETCTVAVRRGDTLVEAATSRPVDASGVLAAVFHSGEARLVGDAAAQGPDQQLVVPLLARGQTLGVLSLTPAAVGRFTEGDLTFAQELARRAALALDNAALLQAARASEERYQALTEATRQYVWTNSPEGEMRGEQPGWAALTGQTPQEYQGYGWSARLHADDRDHAVRAWQEAVRERRPYEVEQRVQVQDGSYRHFLARGVPLLSSSGDIREWVGLHTDVTELRTAEAQLRAWNEALEAQVRERTGALQAANAELDAFNYSVSHDLRTPVRHMLGFAGLLRRSAQTRLDDREQRLLVQVESAATHMNALIDGLLAFARLSREPLHRAAVDLNAVVDEVRATLEPDIGERQVAWQVEPLPAVFGDRQLLKFALTNLLSNALKYSARREIAHIEVAGERRGDEVVLWVRDDGVGFDPAYADRLFGVFQRLHSVRDFEGVGVGLANVQRIAVRHGGRVWAQGQVDAGATFFMTLPAP